MAALPARSAPPPSLGGVARDPRYFSPNADGVRDSTFWWFTLSGDAARVLVQVHANMGGAPGAVIATLLDLDLTPVTDTLAWDGKDSDGDVVADGIYWITATATNTEGTSNAPNLDVIADRTAPRDSVTTPTRGFVNALIHHVAGFASDADPLDTLTVTVSSAGGSQEVPICAPCANDTTTFAIDVQDAVANDDTISVITHAVDRAGNRLQRTRQFLVDSLPPSPPVLDPVPSTVDRPQLAIAGSAADLDSVHLRRDGALIARVRVTSGRFQATLGLPAPGTYGFDAVGIDRFGNATAPSASATVTYTEPIGIDMPERFVAGDRIQVNVASPSSRLTVRVLTLTGRLVRTFETTNPGPNFEFVWNLVDDDGHAAGSGPYIVRVVADLQDGTTFETRSAMVVTR